MLTEFTKETKEEKLGNTAIEIRRRVAGRRLQYAVSEGIISDDTLTKIKSQNLLERKEQMQEQFTISVAGMNERVCLARAEQQLRLQDSLRAIDRDIIRAAGLGRSKVDSLDDLERRVLLMRSQLKQGAVSNIH
jgi:hypothetical protein